MSSINLAIERLRIRIEDAGGQEHRLRAISTRTAAILQELIQQRMVEAGIEVERRRIPQLSADSVRADLVREGDDVVARRLAEAAYLALATALGI